MKHLFIIIGLLWAAASTAQPKALDIRTINGCRVYSDAKAANVFYFEPFGYKLATDKNGRPVLSLLQMHYSGSAATGNSGSIRYRNILQFKIEADYSANEQLQLVKKTLQTQVTNPVLKPLPIAKFSSVLVYAPAENADSSLKLLTNGYTENGSESSSLNGSYWTERYFSIRLSDADAQLLARALENNSAAISMSYAFYTGFSNEHLSSFTATVNGRLNPRVLQYFDSTKLPARDTAIQTVLVKADAVGISADTSRWPGIIKRIEVDAKLPPSYPLLDVYCYDFNNAVRTDLHAKKVEVKATSVNGSDIITSLWFRESQPDVYAKCIRFAYAVRFDKPFYYRITDYTKDGEMSTGQWQERKTWTDLLDITTTANNHQ